MVTTFRMLSTLKLVCKLANAISITKQYIDSYNKIWRSIDRFLFEIHPTTMCNLGGRNEAVHHQHTF